MGSVRIENLVKLLHGEKHRNRRNILSGKQEASFPSPLLDGLVINIGNSNPDSHETLNVKERFVTEVTTANLDLHYILKYGIPIWYFECIDQTNERMNVLFSLFL